MYECEYSREPVDYRLLWLRTIRKIWLILVGTLVGAAVVCCIHSVKKLVLSGGRTYQAESGMWIEYVDHGEGAAEIYLNYYTWNEIAKSDFIVDRMCEKFGDRLSRAEIISAIDITIESDVRYLYSRCTTHDIDLSIKMEQEMELLLQEYASMHPDIFHYIEVINSVKETKEVTNYRFKNAFVLGSIIGFVTALVIWFFNAISTSAIYIPATLEKRYHIPCLGAPSMAEFETNVKALLGDSGKLLVVTNDEKNIPDIIKNKFNVVNITYNNALTYTKDETCEKVLILVEAGKKSGKMLERVIEELSRLEVNITATVLVSEDTKLITQYYRG